MKIYRYRSPEGRIGYAWESSEGLLELNLHGQNLWDGFAKSDKPAAVAAILAPVAPRTILCIGLNYRKHAEETGAPLPSYPVLFMKNPAAVQDPGLPIEIPTWLSSHKVDYEAELAVVIGKSCRNVLKENALEYVLGYTAANDVSARDWQKEGGSQWCRGKGFDTFCPLGPCLVTPESLPDPNTLRIQAILNGEPLQDSNTADMIFSVATIIEFLSASTTLLPGTVVLTGTPSGVGMARKPPRFLAPGDSISIQIEGIGTLTNPVEQEKGPIGPWGANPLSSVKSTA
jgi:2-keto-4-pentenoate hydratase/2-oxohepta-3-ene-1,7-dioic acid hydratase in catechol pathway